MADTKFKVLLVDYKNSETSSEIPFLFHKAGAVVDVFCSDKSWLLKNSHWNSWIDSKSETSHEFADRLRQFVADGKYDWIVLSDESAVNLVNNEIADEQAALELLPISDLKNRSMLGSKSGLSLLCSEKNILTPAFAVYNDAFVIDALHEKVPFPLLLKIDVSRGGMGVFLCKNNDEVQSKMAELTHCQKDKLVFQEYITGETIGVEAIFQEGVLLGYACSKHVQTSGSEFNVSIERLYFECREIENYLRGVGAALSIDGLASMTYLHSKKDSKYYLVEADLRANVWFRLAAFAGIDFSEVILNYLSHTHSLVRPIFLPGKSVVVSFFPRHIMWCLRNRKLIEISKWIFNVGGRWRFIPAYDWKLLSAVLYTTVRASAFFTVRYFKQIRDR